MSVTDVVLQIVMAFFGTIGFGVLFRSRGKKLLLAGLGGMVAWALFLLLGLWIESEPIRYFIVSVIISIYAEVLARICKTPAGTFGILSLVPLVPGGGLYYSADFALSGNMQAFVEKALSTLSLTAMLSVGIVLVAAVAKFLSSSLSRRNRA